MCFILVSLGKNSIRDFGNILILNGLKKDYISAPLQGSSGFSIIYSVTVTVYFRESFPIGCTTVVDSSASPWRRWKADIMVDFPAGKVTLPTLSTTNIQQSAPKKEGQHVKDNWPRTQGSASVQKGVARLWSIQEVKFLPYESPAWLSEATYPSYKWEKRMISAVLGQL